MRKRYLHRRIDVSAGFTADVDWAGTLTLPNFYPDDATFAAGGIDPFNSATGAFLISVELRAGMADDAAAVAPGAMTWSGVVVSWYGDDTFSIGDAAALVPAQKRQIETEIGSATSFVRLTAAASLPVGANAIWVYAEPVKV